MSSNYLIIDYFHEKINNKLRNNGYQHHLRVYKNGIRYEISFLDENNYPFREFGNMTSQKAEKFLEGLWFGLQIGILDTEID